MKKNLIFLSALFFALFIFSNERTIAQAWKLSGNNLTGSEKLGSLDNFDLKFITDNITRMTIKGTTGNGNVGIGTTSPAATLHTNNTGQDALRIQVNSSTKLYVHSGGGVSIGSASVPPANGLFVNGNAGIGIAIPTNKLHVVGNSLLNGHVSVGSEAPDATWHLKIGTTTNDGFLMGTAETLQDFGGSTFGSNSNIVPTSDRVRSLGSSTNRWSAVWTFTGIINTSDIRDKKNIRDLDYGLEKIMQLHPVKFNWKEGINTSDKIGLVAQEIQKILPDVVVDYDVKTDEATGRQEKVPAARLGVNYTDLIPVLIKSIQELQLQITELKQQVNNKTSITSSAANELKINKAATNATLDQNTPNPFNSTTTIRYNIPASISNAQIMITNGSGNHIKTFTLINKGAGSVTIKAGELAAGNYHYTLVVDGKKIDSKQMVLIK